MDRIDVEEECKAWGLEFTGNVSAAGFAECRAVDRDDRNPSAAVNVSTGYYKDLGPGPSFPFFRLGVEYGPYSSFHECQKSLAKKYKVKMPKSGGGKSFWGNVKWKTLTETKSIGLRKELGLNQETLELTGATAGLIMGDQAAVIFPVFDMISPFEKPQKGIVSMNGSGGQLRKPGGPAGDQLLRTISMGQSGIMNRHAIQHWHEADIIYKVEGVTDMLRLQQEIPEDKRNTHLVVTNSAGCDAAQDALTFPDLAVDKTVVVIHDADEPGQFGSGSDKSGGAARWVTALEGRAKAVLNFQLYPDLEPKKGKDLRDWFDEGNTYDDLEKAVRASKEWKLAKKSPPTTSSNGAAAPATSTAPMTKNQLLLKRLEMSVLGHKKTGGILCFSFNKCSKFLISSIDQFTYLQQLVYVGAPAIEIADPRDTDADPDLLDDYDVRVAIAQTAGGKVISRENTWGIGVWEGNGRTVAVGTGEYIVVNGGVDVYREPMCEDKIVDFGEAGDEWYDADTIVPYLDHARSLSWCQEVYDELVSQLSMWKNHEHPQAAETLACLIIATICQSIWDWRPWVALVGQSNTGKTLLFSWIAELLGPLCVATGNTSEAGIRAKIEQSSRALMLDEFEASRHRTSVLEMLMSSNRRGPFGQSIRSSSSQVAVESSYCLLPWFSATEMKMDKETEQNRYMTFRLNKVNNADKEWMKLNNDPLYLADLRTKLVAVGMRHSLKMKERNREILTETVKDSTRQAESYALTSSIYSVIQGYTKEQSINYHRSTVDFLRDTDVLEDADEEHSLALAAVLSSPVRLPGGDEATVGYLLQQETTEGFSKDPEAVLKTKGIRRLPFSKLNAMKDYNKAKAKGLTVDGSYVFFDTSTNGAIRRSLLRGTNYDRQDLRTIFSRLEGSFKGLMSINGAKSKGVYVPMSLCGAVEHMDWPTESTSDFLPPAVDEGTMDAI